MSRSSDECDEKKSIKKEYSHERRGEKRRRDESPRRDRQRCDRSRNDERRNKEEDRRHDRDNRRHDKDDFKVKRESRDDRDDNRRRYDSDGEMRVKRERRHSSSESHRRRVRNGERDREDRMPNREPKRERDQSRSQEDRNNDGDGPHRRRNWKGPRGDNAKPVWGKPGEERDVPFDKKNKQPLDKDGKPIVKEMPNFEKSGKLTEHTNTFNGVVLKYNEPPEARMPKKKWRLYVFKGEENIQVMHIHRQSGFLIGREKKCCDIPLDHPSISQQHAVLQYRSRPVITADGRKTRAIFPYIIDLNSSNGTFLNNEKIEAQIYIQLKETDIIKFGFSTREYVVLCETSTEAVLDSLKDEYDDDDDDDDDDGGAEDNGDK